MSIAFCANGLKSGYKIIGDGQKKGREEGHRKSRVAFVFEAAGQGHIPQGGGDAKQGFACVLSLIR